VNQRDFSGMICVVLEIAPISGAKQFAPEVTR